MKNFGLLGTAIAQLARATTYAERNSKTATFNWLSRSVGTLKNAGFPDLAAGVQTLADKIASRENAKVLANSYVKGIKDLEVKVRRELPAVKEESEVQEVYA